MVMLRRFARLGKKYRDGQAIIRQGLKDECMHVVQDGEVQALLETPEGTVELEVLKPGDMFGEMALFTNTPYEATYIAKGPTRIITIDRKLFLKRISEDPTLAFHLVQELARRIQALETEVQHLKADIS
jgi:CRP-like cAMP-binding protein